MTASSKSLATSLGPLKSSGYQSIAGNSYEIHAVSASGAGADVHALSTKLQKRMLLYENLVYTLFVDSTRIFASLDRYFGKVVTSVRVANLGVTTLPIRAIISAAGSSGGPHREAADPVTVQPGEVSPYQTIESFVGDRVSLQLLINSLGCYAWNSQPVQNSTMTFVVYGHPQRVFHNRSIDFAAHGRCIVRVLPDDIAPSDLSANPKLRFITGGLGVPTVKQAVIQNGQLSAGSSPLAPEPHGYSTVKEGSYAFGGKHLTVSKGGIYTIFETGAHRKNFSMETDAKYFATTAVQLKFIDALLAQGSDLRCSFPSTGAVTPVLSSALLQSSPRTKIQLYEDHACQLQAWRLGSPMWPVTSLGTAPATEHALVSCPPHCPQAHIAAAAIALVSPPEPHAATLLLVNNSGTVMLSTVSDAKVNSTPNVGYSRIRVVNLMSDSVTASIQPQHSNIAAGPQAFTAAKFGEASDFVEVEAVESVVTATAESTPLRGHAAALSCPANVAQGFVYTLLVLKGAHGALRCVMVTEYNFYATASLRTVHAWPTGAADPCHLRVTVSEQQTKPDVVNKPSTNPIRFGHADAYSSLVVYDRTHGQSYVLELVPGNAGNKSSPKSPQLTITVKPSEFWTVIFVPTSSGGGPEGALWAVQDQVHVPSLAKSGPEWLRWRSPGHAGLRWLNADAVRSWAGEDCQVGETGLAPCDSVQKQIKFQQASAYSKFDAGPHAFRAMSTQQVPSRLDTQFMNRDGLYSAIVIQDASNQSLGQLLLLADNVGTRPPFYTLIKIWEIVVGVSSVIGLIIFIQAVRYGVAYRMENIQRQAEQAARNESRPFLYRQERLSGGDGVVTEELEGVPPIGIQGTHSAQPVARDVAVVRPAVGGFGMGVSEELIVLRLNRKADGSAGPAEAAGVRAGERIVAVGGRRLATKRELLAELGGVSVGETLYFTVVSGTHARSQWSELPKKKLWGSASAPPPMSRDSGSSAAPPMPRDSVTEDLEVEVEAQAAAPVAAASAPEEATLPRAGTGAATQAALSDSDSRAAAVAAREEPADMAAGRGGQEPAGRARREGGEEQALELPSEPSGETGGHAQTRARADSGSSRIQLSPRSRSDSASSRPGSMGVRLGAPEPLPFRPAEARPDAAEPTAGDGAAPALPQRPPSTDSAPPMPKDSLTRSELPADI